MLQVNVTLPNGCHEVLSVEPSSKVQDLQIAAQQTFGRRFLRLVTAKNRVLDNPEETIETAGLENGECLTLVVLQPHLAATEAAFALWCCGGQKVVTWGHPAFGGDSSAIQGQLKSVQKIQATGDAFAAILADGSVVTWGEPENGGDCSAVHAQLRNVQQIQSTHHAFAATLADGSVVTWGHAGRGGDSSRVRDDLRNVKQ